MTSLKRIAIGANLTLLGIVRAHLDALEGQLQQWLDDNVDEPKYAADGLQRAMSGLKKGLRHFE